MKDLGPLNDASAGAIAECVPSACYHCSHTAMATPQYTQAKTAPRRHDMAARLRRAKGPLHLGLLHYSVARRVQQPVYAFAAWATIVWALDTYAYMPMVSSGGASSLIGVLAMIVGLLTSFRFSR